MVLMGSILSEMTASELGLGSAVEYVLMSDLSVELRLEE